MQGPHQPTGHPAVLSAKFGQTKSSMFFVFGGEQQVSIKTFNSKKIRDYPQIIRQISSDKIVSQCKLCIVFQIDSSHVKSL